tara:strand:- start:7520 stop:8341 length:822 start_codon:yes stop_codon:yes gene_type:complete
MKNLIYQVWSGNLRPGCEYSKELFEKYADRIGAKYRLDIDPNIASQVCEYNMYYEWLNFMLDDSFLEYDNVMLVDMDVFPIEGLKDNIFEEFASYKKDIGICTEPFQGKYRASTTIGGGINNQNDEAWTDAVRRYYNKVMPRDTDRYVKIYNAGMVMISKGGMIKARERFDSFQGYINKMKSYRLPKFYQSDQMYIHAMAVAHTDYVEMHNGWNGYVHYTRGPLGEKEPIHDGRTAESKMVHIQLSGADFFNRDQLWKITNTPLKEWQNELMG